MYMHMYMKLCINGIHVCIICMHPVDLPKQIVVHFCERRGPMVGLVMIGCDSSSIFRCLKQLDINMHFCTHECVHACFAHSSYMTLFGVHEMNGQVYLSTAPGYPTIANNWTIKNYDCWVITITKYYIMCM